MCQTGNTAEHPKYSQAMGACECMELKPHGPGSTGKVSQLNNLASSHSTFVQCHAAAGFLASKASTASVHSQKALGPVSESIPVLLARSTDAYVPRRGGYLNSSKHAPTQVREKLGRSSHCRSRNLSTSGTSHELLLSFKLSLLRSRSRPEEALHVGKVPWLKRQRWAVLLQPGRSVLS